MRKAVTVVAIIFLVILLLVGVVVWLVQTPPGQDFITRQATSFLRKKLDTRLDIQRIRFDIPDWITLEGLYIEDQSGDTLAAGERMYVNLDMFSLLKGRIGINEINMEGIRLKVNRTLPDTTFNFQFIVDAFDTGEPAPLDTTDQPMEMRLDELILKRVHITYRDTLIGTNAEFNVPMAQVNFEKFNPTQSLYHPTRIVMNGARAKLYLYKALVEASPDTTTAVARSDPSDTLDVKMGDVDIRDFKFDFTDDISGLKSGVMLGRLAGRIDQTHLESQRIVVDNISLENTSAFVEFLARGEASQPQQAPVPVPATEPASPGWFVKVGSLKFTDNELHYDDNTEPRQPAGIDYAHLGIRDFTADLTDFVFSDDSIAGNLERATFREQSGFWVQQARANFAYAARQTYLRDMYLKTPSTLLRDELVLRYRNQEQLTENLGDVQIRMRLQKSQLAYSDVLMLAPDLRDTPPFDKNPDGLLRGDALITGTVDNMLISKADFRTLDGTVLIANGRIRGLPDPDQLAVDLRIQEFATTRADLLRIMPDSALPSTVELPENLAIKGTVKGTLEDMTLNAEISTSLGNGAFRGNIKNPTDTERAAYNGQLSFQEFDMGKFLKQPPEQLGKITLSTEVRGRGFDPKTMSARVDGTVQSASVQGYVYNNLNLEGTIENGLADFVAGINDKNIDLNLTARADINQEYPSINATANINTLDLQALNFYSEPLSFQGNVTANLTSTNPANPLGTVEILDLTIRQGGDPIRLDSVSIQLDSVNGVKEARLKAPFMVAQLSGSYEYERLADLVLTEISKYFTIQDIAYTPVTEPYDLQVEAQVVNHPALQVFVPAITRMDQINFSARIDSRLDTTLKATLRVPLLEYDSIRTEQAGMVMSGVGNRASFLGNVGQVSTESFRVRKASIAGNIADDTALFTLMVRDSVNEARHQVAAGLAQADSAYRFFLRDQLLLDYKIWQADSTGYLQYGKKGLLARDFGIRRQGQSLEINSETDVPNGPINVRVDSLGIGQFVALVTQDSTMMNGKLNGNIVLKDYMETPSFTGDMVVRNLTVTSIPVGDLTVNASNGTADRITMQASLNSDLNDVTIQGTYGTEGAGALDFDLDMNRLSAKTVEAFSFGELVDASGDLTGQAAITGTTEAPRINGDIAFDSVAFEVRQLGARYLINDQTINFKGQQIAFNRFTVQDSLNRNLVVNGDVSIANIPNVGYDLNIRADDFTVLNASRKDNDYFYGNGQVDANINIKGVGTESVIDGSVKLAPGSNITVLMPDDAEGAGSTEGIVEFVDMSDSTSMAKVDSSEAPSTMVVDFASELSLNIEVDDESQLTIVIDELNGDNIKVKGNAQLNTGIAPNGQLYLLGLYELTEGSYDLTFEVLKKQFTIQKGSQILWTGDPLEAEVDITAVYTVNADISALGATPASLGKVPLDVKLIINGNLSSPIVTFDIGVSDRVGEEDARRIEQSNVLANLRNNTADLNKQVFALLVLNRFIADPSASSSSSSSGLNAEAIARQSVSQLLSDQLNLLASDLIQGVNVNFNLNSTAEGATARTDLNVGLSKAFLNDRLTVSVGRNFELENTGRTGAASTEIFDNVAVNYALTEDGRYLVRAYRKNQYQAVLQGFIVETGVSFIITLDYDRFRELFQNNAQ